MSQDDMLDGSEQPSDIVEANKVEEVREIGELSLLSSEECSLARQMMHNGQGYEEVAEELGTEIIDVIYHIRGICNCDVDVEPFKDDQPWRDETVINHLFFDMEMYFKRMADLLGCHDETARNWFDEYNPNHEDVRHTSSRKVRSLQDIDIEFDESLDDAIERHKQKRS